MLQYWLSHLPSEPLWARFSTRAVKTIFSHLMCVFLSISENSTAFLILVLCTCTCCSPPVTKMPSSLSRVNRLQMQTFILVIFPAKPQQERRHFHATSKGHYFLVKMYYFMLNKYLINKNQMYYGYQRVVSCKECFVPHWQTSALLVPEAMTI